MTSVFDIAVYYIIKSLIDVIESFRAKRRVRGKWQKEERRERVRYVPPDYLGFVRCGDRVRFYNRATRITLDFPLVGSLEGQITTVNYNQPTRFLVTFTDVASENWYETFRHLYEMASRLVKRGERRHEER